MHALWRPYGGLVQVGDSLVIASSSFYAEEVDETTIKALSYAPGTDTTTITLAQPLVYTHLGEVVSVAGEAKVLDMRAEVTVLTRNVLVTVGQQAEGGVGGLPTGQDTALSASVALVLTAFSN